MQPRSLLQRAQTALGIVLVLLGCSDPTGLSLPDGAARMETIPLAYLTWWQEVSACSGRRHFFSTVHWYVVPGDVIMYRGRGAQGLAFSHPPRIVLASTFVNDPKLVRHEMLHILLGVDGHPTEYFVRRCGELVYPS